MYSEILLNKVSNRCNIIQREYWFPLWRDCCIRCDRHNMRIGIRQ